MFSSRYDSNQSMINQSSNDQSSAAQHESINQASLGLQKERRTVRYQQQHPTSRSSSLTFLILVTTSINNDSSWRDSGHPNPRVWRTICRFESSIDETLWNSQTWNAEFNADRRIHSKSSLNCIWRMLRQVSCKMHYCSWKRSMLICSLSL